MDIATQERTARPGRGTAALFLIALSTTAIAQAQQGAVDGRRGVETAVPTVTIYAAGSLRDAMQTLERAFVAERAATRPARIVEPAADKAPFNARYLFGPSGKLRERIEAGEGAHLFASASPVHTERLVAGGTLRSSNAFASNSLCVVARQGVALAAETLVATLLDPAVKLGTSTPGADPSGDYTWEMFRKIEATLPGTYAKLDAKALRLVGAEINAAETKAPYADLLAAQRADVFVTYCTNARSAQRDAPGLNVLSVPAVYDVATSYTIGIAPNAPEIAREFLRYVLSQRAQKVLAELGFSPPTQRCDHVESHLEAAHAAWSGTERSLRGADGAGLSAPPSLRLAARYALVLQPAEALRFRRRAQGNAVGTFGGAAQFVATASDRLEVFVDRRAWIEVVRVTDQVSLAPVRSERWLGCAGVGKNLGFSISVGERYELRLSEVDGAQAAVLLMPMSVSTSTKRAP